MIAYFISLIILGIPICWVEWTMGRYGGLRGLHSCPGILQSIVKHPVAKYLGVLGIIIPVVIYMYYVYIEAWCLGYAVNFAAGNLNLENNVAAYAEFWQAFIGFGADGSAIGFGVKQVGLYLLAVFAFNFFLIYRGLNKGIEFFCKYAMPALVILAIIILVRVLTLGTPLADKPDQSIVNGLGYMWNPEKVFVQEATPDPNKPGAVSWTDKEELVGEAVITARTAEAASNPGLRIVTRSIRDQLKNPQLWLAASGQIFFSLSVGFGVIIVYASYLRRKDDIVLSGLSASSANEFCEVALGGLITLPAGFVFLGAAGLAGQGTFGLGFNVLPLVFSEMPAGTVFGVIFFILLFLAAVTSSLSMLQPGIAFLEEALNIDRRQSCALLGLITAVGCAFVVYFSKDVKALDTMDFWVGTFLLFVLATIQVIVFGWVLGIEKGWKEAHHGAEMRIPSFFKVIIKYICPAYLLVIFVCWVLNNVFGYDFTSHTFNPTGYVRDLVGAEGEKPSLVAWLTIGLILAVAVFNVLIIRASRKRWHTPH